MNLVVSETGYGTTMLSSKCAMFVSKKSRFIKKRSKMIFK